MFFCLPAADGFSADLGQGKTKWGFEWAGVVGGSATPFNRLVISLLCAKNSLF